MLKKKKPAFKIQDIKIRKARLRDLPQLLKVEEVCFDYDRLSRRSFQWMIKHAHSIFLVQEYKGQIVGYGLVLINSGTSLARLYSICTLTEFQGGGLGANLIAELETRSARDEDCAYLRLEVKEENTPAIGLYHKLGYQKFAEKKDYYDDGQTALCFEKRIRHLEKEPRLNIPYYQQGTDFTCGPACLLMAMKTFKAKSEVSLSQELEIWREATTIFMTSGHGGCGPRGLALAAFKRGLTPELFLSHNNVLFIDSVRSPEKKRIIELVQKDFEKKIILNKIKVHKKRLTLQDLKESLNSGGIPLVLISTFRFDRSRSPHWVIVTACDEQFVYIHDPDRDEDEGHTGVINRMHIPIPKDQFLKVSRLGKDRMSATIVVYS